MGFYQDQIVPLLINLSMRQKNLAAYRNRVVPTAEGRVLEIGIGSGLNLPFYSSNAQQVIGLDPSPKLLAMARRSGRVASGYVEFIEGSAEKIPLDSFRSAASRGAKQVCRIEWYLDRRHDADSFETLTIDGHVRNCQQQQVLIIHHEGGSR
jgi:SAM-dependent methyltransferase